MSCPETPARGTVLAFDWGEKRIGVAVGELELRTAHPVGTLERKGREQDAAALDDLVKQWHPVLAVVGLPRRDDGEHPLAARCRGFARRLQSRHGIPVRMVDEHLSSWAAEDLLKAGNTGWRQRRDHLDPVAAQQILETFFELTASAARP